MPVLPVRPSSALRWLGAGLLLLSMAAIAGEVYQWKDARGVTHYADAPPPNQAHRSRTITVQGAPVVPVASKPAAANSDCTNARSNLTILKGKAELGLDEDKDGKVDRNLTAQERASRTQLAELAVKTYCEVALANEP
jgi:hypothetical protein